MKEKTFTLRLKLTALMFGLLLVTPLCAAERAVDSQSGEASYQNDQKVVCTVTDGHGPIVGANVQIKGTQIGVVTDVNGSATLRGVTQQSVLIVSYLGYVTQEVTVGTKTNIEVKLSEDSQAVDEIVVVGYGTQKKVNLTGSVSFLNVEETMKSRTVTNLSNSLSGMMAGVTALQSSGAPGSDGATVRVRGLGTLNSSAPLILIDGIEGVMDSVNPSDVESISVLKDAASSAIYGARAANGVVLITTKKGKRGQLNVTYDGHVSLLTAANKYDFVTDYADYMELMNEAAYSMNTGDYFTQANIDLWREKKKDPNGISESGYPNYAAYPNTDWESYLFGTNVLQEHNVSVNGGGDNVRYLFSAGYQNNPGLVDNTGVERFTLRFNADAQVTKWLNVGMNTFASQQDYDISLFSTANTYLIATTPGTYPVYEGVYGGPSNNEDNSQDNNLAWYLDRGQGYNRVSRFNTTMFAKVNFTKNLVWETNYNYMRRIDEKRTWDKGEQYKVNFRTGDMTSTQTALANMSVGTYNYQNRAYTLESMLRYNATIARDHEIGALLGYQEYYYYTESLSTSKKGFLDYTITVPSAVTEMVSTTGSASDTATRSAFARVNYAYKSRYLFEANLRYDGSSRFDKSSRFGWFPSFSAGWRISEENFMEGTRSVLDDLKIRASWGKLGNSSIAEYSYQSTYGNTKYSLNNVQSNGLASGKIANSSLRWESTAVTNIGIDAIMFNNRLTIGLEAYNKFTDGILYQPTIYMTAGNKTAPYMNIAEVTNKGIELTVGWRDRKGDFSYSISGNIAYNHNEVSKYKGQLEQGWVTNEDGTKTYKSNLGDVSTGGSTRVLEGKIINEYYMLDTYKGNGQYYNSDGTVNISGGPTDGMIRTEADMDWVNAMIAAGYKFMPNQSVGRGTKIWYGDYLYADNNEDGIYGNSYDNRFQGCSSRPPVFYGLQLYAGWKGLDVSTVLSGTMFSKLYWAPGVAFSTSMRHGYEISKDVANDHYFYNPDDPTDPRTNTTAKWGRLMGESGYQNHATSTLYLYDANYLKIKNLTIGYTLPQRIATKIFTKSLRVYVNAENLFTFTKYPGMDPELGSGHTYMVARTFSLGANITF